MVDRWCRYSVASDPLSSPAGIECWITARSAARLGGGRRPGRGALGDNSKKRRNAGLWRRAAGGTRDNGAMASTNEEVAALLREYAELLGLTGGDPFRARNYEKAAKAVAGYPDDLATLPDTRADQDPRRRHVDRREDRRVPAHRDVQGGRRPARQAAAGRQAAREGARRRPEARAAARPRARRHQRRRARRGGRAAAGCAACPGSAPRPRSASCAASRWRRATPRCATPCARCRPRHRTTSTRCSPPTSRATRSRRPGRSSGADGRTAASVREKDLIGSRTSAATCTRTPTSPTASSPWRE